MRSVPAVLFIFAEIMKHNIGRVLTIRCREFVGHVRGHVRGHARGLLPHRQRAHARHEKYWKLPHNVLCAHFSSSLLTPTVTFFTSEEDSLSPEDEDSDETSGSWPHRSRQLRSWQLLKKLAMFGPTRKTQMNFDPNADAPLLRLRHSTDNKTKSVCLQ